MIKKFAIGTLIAALFLVGILVTFSEPEHIELTYVSSIVDRDLPFGTPYTEAVRYFEQLGTVPETSSAQDCVAAAGSEYSHMCHGGPTLHATYPVNSGISAWFGREHVDVMLEFSSTSELAESSFRFGPAQPWSLCKLAKSLQDDAASPRT